jgi:hypothetical protein
MTALRWRVRPNGTPRRHAFLPGKGLPLCWTASPKWQPDDASVRSCLKCEERAPVADRLNPVSR